VTAKRSGGSDRWCGGRRCGGGVEGTAGDGGGCFGTVLEWFWKYKIHSKYIEECMEDGR